MPKNDSIPPRREILIVEDNLINSEILASVLEDTYNIVQASNGAEAFDLLRSHEHNFSCILLDLYMPIMDGRQLLRLMQDDATLKKIPVIVVTGETSQDAEYECLDLGAADFIAKPIVPRIAQKRVASVIRLRETGAKLAAVWTDPETNLLTRHGFLFQANKVLERYEGEPLSLVVGHLCDFPTLEANHGPSEMADLLLDLAAKAESSQGTYANAYLGEGRFVSLTTARPKEELVAYVQLLSSSTSKRLGTDAFAKCGVVYNITKDTNVARAINCAIAALREIDDDVHSFVGIWNEEMSARLDRRRTIVSTARQSLENGDFYVAYQPKHDAKTHALVGCEALVRWQHPELGFISPAEFIPIFESNGFILELDEFVRLRGYLDMVSWDKKGIEVVPLSSNYSKRELSDVSYIKEMVDIFQERNEYPAKFFRAEITETMWADDHESVAKSIQIMADSGYHIELDDFGSGYSSLAMIANTPISTLKLDMSLIRELDVQEHTVLRSVQLAHDLGISVVAEGVEDAQTAARLAELDVDVLQGYFFAKPMRADEFEAYMLACAAK